MELNTIEAMLSSIAERLQRVENQLNAPAATSQPQTILHHGDCIDYMRGMAAESVDFVLTDPPYLVNYKDRTGRTLENDSSAEWVYPAFSNVARVMKKNTLCFSFYGWNRVHIFMRAWLKAGLVPVAHFTFTKNYVSSEGFARNCHENGYLLAKGNPPKPEMPPHDVMTFTYTGNDLHPTQKPVALLQQLIAAYCPRGGVVLDPFAGSGSTAEAALYEDCGFIAIEKNETYFTTARNRLFPN
ncbi:DNA methyltransferase, partial [Nostoc linckia]